MSRILNVKTFENIKYYPIFSWEIIVPHPLVVVETVEKVEESGNPDHCEEKHHEGVEELDHVPVHALIPEVHKTFLG